MGQESERRSFGGAATRTYRIIFALATGAFALALLGIPGVIIAARFLPMGAMHVIALFILVGAVLSDLTAVYFYVTYLLRGGGFHQDPFGALAYYIVFAIFGMEAAWWWRLLTLIALTAFHFACHWYLPQPIARRLGWRPEPPRQRR